MDWKAKGGKSRLIRDVAAKGLSFRQAEKAVNGFFAVLKAALARGDTIHFPFGTLRTKQVRERKKRSRLLKSRNIATGEQVYRIQRYPKGRRIVELHAKSAFIEVGEFPEELRLIQQRRRLNYNLYTLDISAASYRGMHGVEIPKGEEIIVIDDTRPGPLVVIQWRGRELYAEGKALWAVSRKIK